MNPYRVHNDPTRPPNQGSSLSPLAPPFVPRDQMNQRMTQFESGQQSIHEGLNSNGTEQASSLSTLPVDLTMPSMAENQPDYGQIQHQSGFIHPQSDEDIGQNTFASDSLSLHSTMQENAPGTHTMNQFSLSNADSQFDHINSQDVSSSQDFNPRTQGFVFRPEDFPPFPIEENRELQNRMQLQSVVSLSNNQTIRSQSNHNIENEIASEGLNQTHPIDESDARSILMRPILLCGFHFKNVLWRFLTEDDKGLKAKCFVCNEKAMEGIVIPEAGDTSEIGACSSSEEAPAGAFALSLLRDDDINEHQPTLVEPKNEKSEEGEQKEKDEPERNEFNFGTPSWWDEGPGHNIGRSYHQRPESSRGERWWRRQHKSKKNKKQPPKSDDDPNQE